MIGRLFLILVILFVIYVALTTGEDVKNIKRKDAAIRSSIEVILYSSFWAMVFHRIAHRLYNHRLFFLARIISQFSRLLTGIEIHPGAKIGKDVFIDHGMGVVIGETAEVSNNVTIYQGVTLGGTGKDVGKRHPTIGNNVMIGSGAKVLGPINVGDNSKIGAGSVVVKDVPPFTTVTGVPGKVVAKNAPEKECPADSLDQKIDDPVGSEIDALTARINELETELKKCEEERNNYEAL